MAEQVDDITREFEKIVDHGDWNFPPPPEDDDHGRGGGGDDGDGGLWELLKQIGTTIICILGVIAPIAVTMLIIVNVMGSAAKEAYQQQLNQNITTTQQNVTHGLNANNSLAAIIDDQQTYIAGQAKAIIKINPGVCGTHQTDAYTITGTIPDQQYYIVYNSLTGKTETGTYTNIKLVPQLIC